MCVYEERHLALIHVVIGVDGVFAAQLSSQDLDGSVADHLVDVHVALGARARLPHYQGEMLVQFT